MTLKKLRALTYITALTIIALFSGCKKSTYYQLTEEDMTWLCYKNNELLTFGNQNGDTTQFYVTVRSKSYVKDGDTYSEFTAADLLQLNDTTAIDLSNSQGGIYITTGENGLSVYFSFPHYPVKHNLLNNQIPSAATIGGINYADVISLNATGLTDIIYYNNKLWVSKSKGILQYEDILGNVWIRTF